VTEVDLLLRGNKTAVLAHAAYIAVQKRKKYENRNVSGWVA